MAHHAPDQAAGFGFSLQRPRFNSSPFPLEFVTEVMGQVCLRVLLSTLVSISSLLLHTRLQVSPTLQNFSNGQCRYKCTNRASVVHVAFIGETNTAQSQLVTVSQEKWLPARLGVEGQIKKGSIGCNMWIGVGYIEFGLG
jgi:hypothetical protein